MNLHGESLGLQPLFSAIFTFYTLLILGCPSFLWRFFYDPVVPVTFTLLLYLLRQGASQNYRSKLKESDADLPQHAIVKELSHFEHQLRSFDADYFVEWDVRAPLEVIHEEYEGEDAAEARRETEMRNTRRYASLSLFHPESDEDSSSEGESSSDNMCFRWEDDNGNGLIEIALENRCGGEIDEENLIEIDISRRDDVGITVAHSIEFSN